ncbi:MAG: type 2 isopentenyl-diphosphate Delta-isomerase [Infirmifilum sp.]
MDFKISSRKDSHIILSVLEDVSARETTWFEHVKLIHQTILDSSLSDVSLETKFFGVIVDAPIIISGMTGGTELAKKVNSALAQIAHKFNIPIGVGSQRAALEDRSLAHTYTVVRENAPEVPVIANIGMSQITTGLNQEDILYLVEMIDANAIAVHLNPLQESLQPEGEPDFKGFLEKLRYFVREAPVPVIVKQTGEGVSREAASKLKDTGVKGIDVGGLGGTSFAVIEGLRARSAGLAELFEAASTFSNWGIPTAASILEVREVLPDILLIATGGIKTGVDVAKSLRLGADFAGIARLVLKELYNGGVEKAERFISRILRELRTAIFLTGGVTLEDLKNSPIFIDGRLLEWIRQRKLKVPGWQDGRV